MADSVEYLDLGHNEISSLPELSLPNLKYLNLEKNKLRNIDGIFNLLPTLQVLTVAENRISAFSASTFAGMDNLISLDASGNGLERIPPGVFKNEYLNEVNISGNLLTELAENTFSDLSILEVLDLSHNRLNAINNGAFNNIPRLKSLMLAHNRLSSYKGDFFVNLYPEDTDLHTLDLSHNQLTYLYPESFMYHPQLKKVDMAGNEFSFFPTQFIKGLKNLEELDLSQNSIKSIAEEDFANLFRLKKLDLNGNEVGRLFIGGQGSGL